MIPCKMISLDTSTSNTGFAIWENAVLKKYGCINKEKIEKEDKLKEMILSLSKILNKENPDIIVIEITSVPTNANTQRLLSMLLGYVYAWSVIYEKEYTFFRPSQWRKLVYGENAPKGSKNLKERALKEVFNKYQIKTTNDNIAEAILIGEAKIREYNLDYKPEFEDTILVQDNITDKEKVSKEEKEVKLRLKEIAEDLKESGYKEKYLYRFCRIMDACIYDNFLKTTDINRILKNKNYIDCKTILEEAGKWTSRYK